MGGTQIESFVRGGWGDEEDIWCEMEVGIEGCRKFCSELHIYYCSPDIINIIVARKLKHVSCRMHILLAGIQSLLRKPEQEGPLTRLQRIM